MTDRPPPGISAVVCTYNGANRLPAVLEHLAAQSTPAELTWEVLVVDNADPRRGRQFCPSRNAD